MGPVTSVSPGSPQEMQSLGFHTLSRSTPGDPQSMGDGLGSFQSTRASGGTADKSRKAKDLGDQEGRHAACVGKKPSKAMTEWWRDDRQRYKE